MRTRKFIQIKINNSNNVALYILWILCLLKFHLYHCSLSLIMKSTTSFAHPPLSFIRLPSSSSVYVFTKTNKNNKAKHRSKNSLKLKTPGVSTSSFNHSIQYHSINICLPFSHSFILYILSNFPLVIAITVMSH